MIGELPLPHKSLSFLDLGSIALGEGTNRSTLFKPGMITLEDADFGRIDIEVIKDKGSTVTLLDMQKKIRAAIGYTELETTKTGSTQIRPTSSLVLFDKEGKVIWKAPDD